MGTARGGRLHKFDQEYRCGTLQPGGAANPTRGNVLLVVGDVFETLLV